MRSEYLGAVEFSFLTSSNSLAAEAIFPCIARVSTAGTLNSLDAGDDICELVITTTKEIFPGKIKFGFSYPTIENQEMNVRTSPFTICIVFAL